MLKEKTKVDVTSSAENVQASLKSLYGSANYTLASTMNEFIVQQFILQLGSQSRFLASARTNSLGGESVESVGSRETPKV